MTDTFSRAQQILADIREDDPKKLKAWEWVCRAYEVRGFAVKKDERYSKLLWWYMPANWQEPGAEIPKICEPLFKSLDTMREFELALEEKNRLEYWQTCKKNIMGKR